MTRKGAIRAAMELALKDYGAARRPGVDCSGGRFFGPRAGNNWFSQGLVKPGQLPASLATRGRSAWGISGPACPTSPPPIAALLARRRELEPFARFHMQGHWDPDGSEMSQAIQRVVARYGGRAVVKSFPWWLGEAGGALQRATLREMVEDALSLASAGTPAQR